MIAGNIPFPMRFVCQIPLMHFQKISKAQEPNTYLLSFYFPGNQLVLKFTQPKGTDQAMLFIQRVNDGKFHFTKYFCVAGACEEQSTTAASKQELPLSDDPLFVQQAEKKVVGQEYGFKMLQRPVIDHVKQRCEEYCDWLLKIVGCSDFKPEMLSQQSNS